MAKKLQLVFKTAANTTSTVSIENAKEGLTLDEAKDRGSEDPAGPYHKERRRGHLFREGRPHHHHTGSSGMRWMFMTDFKKGGHHYGSTKENH